MKKVLLSALSVCSLVAMGQISDYGLLQHNSTGTLKSDRLKGHTTEAYELMRYHANNPTYRVYQSKSNVASDKAEVILEAHKVFGEFASIGFQMLLDADATAYGELFYDFSNGYFGTYDDFEYKIPENADPSESSTNIVFDGEAAIEIPVGTYDFMILYPFPGDGLMFTGGEYAKFDNFEFKGGNTYRFVIEYAENDEGYFTDMAFLYTDVDIALTALNLPANSMDMTDSEDISVEIKNRGTSAASGFQVSYRIDDNQAVTETCSTTIEAGESYVYTFSAKADLSVEKQYEIEAWVTFDGDMIASNDSMTGKCKHIGVASLPYTYDFSKHGAEGLASDWIVENVNEDYSKWEYSDWTIDANGESGAVSCGGAYGGDQTGNDNLISSPVSLPAGDIHMIVYTKCVNGTEATELLDVRYGTTTNVDEMTVIGDYTINQTEWVKRIINFNVAEAGTYYFAFHVKSVGGMNVFIDNITIDAGYHEVSPYLSVERVVLPYSNCDLSDTSKVGAVIKNTGTGPTSEITLSYTVNGENKVTETFEAVIQPTESETFYFNTPADFAEVGEYRVYITATSATEQEGAMGETVFCYEPVTTLPVTTNFTTSENYEYYWTVMTPGTWGADEWTSIFGSSASGLENGLLTHCFYLENPVRIKVQYSKSGWSNCAMHIAYGKSGTDVSTYETIYENNSIQGDTEAEFIVPVSDPDSYSFVIVNDSEDDGNISLHTFTISNLAEYDLRIDNVTYPASNYTPKNQLAAEGEYIATIVNRGSKDMTDVKVSLYNGETLLGSSETGITLASDEVADIAMKATLPAVEVGSKLKLSMKVEAAQADAYEADNIYNINTINVTDNVYATENMSEFTAGTGSWGGTIYIGNVYTLTTSDILESVTIGFVPISEAEADMASKKVAVAIYKVDSDLSVSTPICRQEFERGFGGFSDITFDPMKLSAGTYYIEVQQLTTYNMGLGYDGSDASNFCYQNIDGKLTKTNGASLVVRANFNSDLTVYAKDAVVKAFTAPIYDNSLFSDNETISVNIKNNGYEDATIPVSLSVNGAEHTSEITLPAYNEGVVEFTGIDMSAVGEYTVVAQTKLEGDEVTENNELSKIFTSVEEANPYVMDFESCHDFDAAPDKFNPRWTTIDRNNTTTDFFWRYEHKYRGEAVGFMAFNPSATTPEVNPDDLPGFTTNSGERLGVAFCVGWNAEGLTSDVWLISPKLKLGEGSSFELYVKTRILESMDQELEKYRLLISTTDNNFESFVTLGDDIRQAALEWEKVEVNLSEYDNQDVYVAIQYIGEPVKNVCLMVDDIKVNTTLSATSVLSDNLSINHYDETLIVTANNDIERIEIINIDGQLLESTNNINTDRYSISTAEYAPGIYIAKAFTGAESKVLKFIVR